MKLLTLLFFPTLLFAQFTTKSIPLLPGEQWYGGRTADAHLMPFESGYTADLRVSDGGAVQPLLLSNRGRYVYAAKPFRVAVTDSTLEITSRTHEKVSMAHSGKTLREAREFAAHYLMERKQALPDSSWFAGPVYAIRPPFDQVRLIAFAEAIIDKRLPAGIISLADGWQMDHGNWSFDPTIFPDPSGMSKRLHDLGFRLQLTVSPFVSTEATQQLKVLGAVPPLLRNPNRPNEAKVIEWAGRKMQLIDFSHPGGKEFMQNALDELVREKGVDGFYFAHGDFEHFDFVISHRKNLPAWSLSNRYADLARTDRPDQISADFGRGGKSVVRSLSLTVDSEEKTARLLSSVSNAGLFGFPIFCVSPVRSDPFDVELYIRHARLQASLPILTLGEEILMLNDEQLDTVRGILNRTEKDN